MTGRHAARPECIEALRDADELVVKILLFVISPSKFVGHLRVCAFPKLYVRLPVLEPLEYLAKRLSGALHLS